MTSYKMATDISKTLTALKLFRVLQNWLEFGRGYITAALRQVSRYHSRQRYVLNIEVHDLPS